MSNVYQRNDGVWVYRMSAIGRCLKALTAERAGLEALEPPQWMEERMEEGKRLEDTILEMSDRKIDRQQMEVTVEVKSDDEDNDGVVLVGHIDGMTDAYGISEEWDDGLVEVKKFRDSLWEAWYSKQWMESGAERLLEVLPVYAWQMSAYMYGLGVRWGLFVVGHAETKEEDEGREEEEEEGEEVVITNVDTTIIERPPVGLRAIKGKVLKIEDMAEKFADTSELPSCDRRDFPCPFFYLEDDEESEEGPDELDLLASTYKQGLAYEDRGEELKKKAGPEILQIFDARDRKGQKMVTKNWSVKDTLREGRKYPNFKKMKEDGIEVEKYMEKGKDSRYPKITPRRKHE